MGKLFHGSQSNIRRKYYTSIYSRQIFHPEIIYNYGRGKIKFIRICLKQDSESFIHVNVVNIYISYELDTWLKDLNTDFTPGNCLSDAVKLT